MTMDSTLRRKFAELLEEEDLLDPSWIESLTEFDEPPLFSRSSRISFLRDIPADRRVAAALEIALECLESIAEYAANSAPHKMFFMCVTFYDYDQWLEESRILPRIAIQVNPDYDDDKMTSTIAIVSPWSREAIRVENALNSLGFYYANRYRVGEREQELFDPDIDRIYVGWRKDPSNNVRGSGAYFDKSQGASCFPGGSP